MGRSASHVQWQGGGARIRVACLMMWPIFGPKFSRGDVRDPAPHLEILSAMAFGGLTALITTELANALQDLLEGNRFKPRLGAR